MKTFPTDHKQTNSIKKEKRCEYVNWESKVLRNLEKGGWVEWGWEFALDSF